MRIILLTACISGLFLPIAFAQSPQQFDLICVGTEASRPNGATVPYQDHYEIDLAAMQWCNKFRCGTIFSLDNQNITFAESQGVTHYVNRKDGKLTDFMYNPPSIYWDRKTACEPASFSGFAKGKF